MELKINKNSILKKSTTSLLSEEVVRGDWHCALRHLASVFYLISDR